MAKKATSRRRKVEGNPSGRPLPLTTTIAPLTDPPAVPDGLGEYGEEMWVRVSSQLVERRTLTAADLDALRVLCDAWQQYRELQPMATGKAAFFETTTGYVTEHPAVRQRHQAAKTLQQLWSRFGLTPVDRQRMDVEVGSNDDEDGPDIRRFAKAR
jgi:P27 family predicted phage terminase small subunit